MFGKLTYEDNGQDFVLTVVDPDHQERVLDVLHLQYEVQCLGSVFTKDMRRLFLDTGKRSLEDLKIALKKWLPVMAPHPCSSKSASPLSDDLGTNSTSSKGSL